MTEGKAEAFVRFVSFVVNPKAGPRRGDTAPVLRLSVAFAALSSPARCLSAAFARLSAAFRPLYSPARGLSAVAGPPVSGSGGGCQRQLDPLSAVAAPPVCGFLYSVSVRQTPAVAF